MRSRGLALLCITVYTTPVKRLDVNICTEYHNTIEARTRGGSCPFSFLGAESDARQMDTSQGSATTGEVIVNQNIEMELWRLFCEAPEISFEERAARLWSHLAILRQEPRNAPLFSSYTGKYLL